LVALRVAADAGDGSAVTRRRMVDGPMLLRAISTADTTIVGETKMTFSAFSRQIFSRLHPSIPECPHRSYGEAKWQLHFYIGAAVPRSKDFPESGGTLHFVDGHYATIRNRHWVVPIDTQSRL
jgi:hypothetical protein